MQFANELTSVGITVFLGVVFIFSPIAGFLADVQFSRFKVLKCSLYITLAANVSLLLVGVLMVYTVKKISHYFFVLLVSLVLALLLHVIGHMMFVSNILEFGTNQLHDAPSQDSVIFLCWYFWIRSFTTVISVSTHIIGLKSFINIKEKTFYFDKFKINITILILCLCIGVFCVHLGYSSQETNMVLDRACQSESI